MRPRFQRVRGTWATWHKLFGSAAQIASEVRVGRPIGFPHSEDANEGVITVGYWGEPVKGQPRATENATYEVFRGTWTRWQSLFEQASDFTAGIAPDRLIDIPHSEYKDQGVVMVWYGKD